MKYLSTIVCSAFLIAFYNMNAMETNQKDSKTKGDVYITLDPTPIDCNAVPTADAPWWGEICGETGVEEFDEVCNKYGFHEVDRSDKDRTIYFKCGSDYWNKGSLKETGQAMRDLRKLSCVKSVKLKDCGNTKAIATVFEQQAFDQLSFEVMECARVE